MVPDDVAAGEQSTPVLRTLADKVNWLIDRAHPAGRGRERNGIVEKIDDDLAETERLASLLHEPGHGARVQLAVAPCSPFSVTGRLMEESAALARRLGLLMTRRAGCQPGDPGHRCMLSSVHGIAPSVWACRLASILLSGWVAAT